MDEQKLHKREAASLLLLVFIAASCSIFYELLISTVSSYFLGDSVLYFSITIGLFLSFMGVGSFLSKYITRDLITALLVIEMVIGVVGGLSALILYATFSLTEYYHVTSFLLIATISTLIGLEIPLLTRLLQKDSSFKDALAHVLSVDYLGALIASILFPLVLLPYFGLLKTAFLIGIINLLAALVGLLIFRTRLRRFLVLFVTVVICLASLAVGLARSFSVASFFEQLAYQDEIVFSQKTQYQNIVLTKYRDDLRLFLNGQLQFSSIDEYRYHESLIHIPFGLIRKPEDILILGGGDGLAVREILKYPSVHSITLIDIDPNMTKIGRDNPLLTAINDKSLNDPKVHIINTDAFAFLQNQSNLFSVIIADLPDPDSPALSKLYSREFYELAKHHLAEDGIFVTQSTSPYFAREPYWMIYHTIHSVFDHVIPYTVYVPSFGQWGFQMASNVPLNISNIKLPNDLRFLDQKNVQTLFIFDKDIGEVPTDINTLNNPVLFRVHEQSWDQWN